MFKINNGFSQISFLNLFHNNNNEPDFQILRINTTLSPYDILNQQFATIFLFKYVLNFLKHLRQIRKWKPTNCSCKLCKTYVKDLGFINISQ